MSNYQRLISYIYAYEGGIKGKNIGFAKLEARGRQCRITVSVKKIFVGGNPIGIYLITGGEEIRIGTLFARNGAGEFRTMVSFQNVEESGYSLEQCCGLTIHDTESAWRCYTTIWEDAVAHAAEVELAGVTSHQKGIDGEERSAELVLPSVSEEIEAALAMESESCESEPQTAKQSGDDTELAEKIVADMASAAAKTRKSRLQAAKQSGDNMESAAEEIADRASAADEAADAEPAADETIDRTSAANEEEDAEPALDEAEDAEPALDEAEDAEPASDEAVDVVSASDEETDTESVVDERADTKSVADEKVDVTSAAEEKVDMASAAEDTAPECEEIVESAEAALAEPRESFDTDVKPWCEGGMFNAGAQIDAHPAPSRYSGNSGSPLHKRSQPIWRQPALTPPGQQPFQPRPAGEPAAERAARVSDPFAFLRPHPTAAQPSGASASRRPSPLATQSSHPSAGLSPDHAARPIRRPAWREAAPQGRNRTAPPVGIVCPVQDDGDMPGEQELWEMLRRRYPKVQAFDYADGCEILAIKPQDIGLLPRETWVYGNNSFLLHGYYNFRYLILARLDNPAGVRRYLLGVPGHYFNNEKYMASMFGFADFVLSKEQPAGDDRFGYWYTDIRLGEQ